MALFDSMIGRESKTAIEFAPFQKVPKAKKKLDPRAGTLQDGMYIIWKIQFSLRFFTDAEFQKFINGELEAQDAEEEAKSKGKIMLYSVLELTR